MRLTLIGFLSLCVMHFSAWTQTILHPELEQSLPDQAFPMGVASGDPGSDRIVLWTMVLPPSASSLQVGWKIASDTSMFNVIQSGRSTTDIERGGTVKVQVTGLPSASILYYQFSWNGKVSAIGRTRTTDLDPKALRFAVVSCSDYQTGHFNAYRHISERHDLDAVIHLGDYIYETSAEKWGPAKQRKRMFRSHLPRNLCITLQDYRTRYAQYRTDPWLREAHRLHPFISVWDDHEFSNNAHSELNSGAQMNRREAARQAYFEWLPVRDHVEQQLYRKVAFGTLVDLWMLDTRQEGRMEQAENDQDPRWQSAERTMLGEGQSQWLTNGMADSKAVWQLLGNQVIFSPIHDSKVFSRVPAIKMDRWDGYPAARNRLIQSWLSNDLKNIVVLTGDVHTAWGLELDLSIPDTMPTDEHSSLGIELVTPSISSFNFNDILPRPIAWEAERRFKKRKHNPHLKYLDLVRHGYVEVSVTPDAVQADWLFFNPRRSTSTVQQQRTYRYAKDGSSFDRIKTK